ncbi:MAG: Mfa1 family fimbria major subunit [Bacteroidaceae bacterium]|nr:Mfa1 family fimbria major subunit [Bacteroidaceae bacterium]
MKKSFLSMFALAALLMTGCSSEEVTPNSGDVTGGNAEAETSYLSVNLMSTAATRAAAGYEDGTSVENKISKVRFYFFTESGAPANVKLQGSTYVNYYDWTPAEGDQIKDPTSTNDVESRLKQATIVISTQKGDKLPQQMVAVLNPTESEGASRTLSQLKGLTKDYADANLTTEGKFVMFNSVYASNGKEICAVPITSDNLGKTEALARETPVTIYVERNVAKVDCKMETGLFTDGKLALKDKNGNDLKVGGKQVYLKINGWKVTAETTEGRLGKRMDLEWPLNYSGTHRSFWAINASTATNRYCDYNDIKKAIGASLYTNENAEDYTNSDGQSNNLNHSKVIISGKLYDEDGNDFTIVRHLGAHFADTPSDIEAKNFPELKKNILSQLTANGNHFYYETEKDGEKIRTQIGVDDLKILIAEQEEKENSQNNCYVYAQLTDDAKAKTWYDSPDKDAKIVSSADINTELAKKGTTNKDGTTDPSYRALVWKNGMTYYYYEINHTIGFTAPVTFPGVVRNHWYATTVTKIAGLGTPVYDPDQVIYPEKPDPNEFYIAAQINILSWRIVSNNYELEW